MSSTQGGADDDALRREVLALRAEVAELQRAAARHEDTLGISLAEREELMRGAERIAHLGTWTWDMKSGRVTWSDEMYRILGLDPDQVAPSVERFFESVHPDDRARAQESAQQGIVDGVLPFVDCRIVRPDGSIRHTTSSASYLFDAAGKPQRVVGGVLDRTHSLETEAKLRRTLLQLEEAQQMAQLGSWRFDPQTEELEWSNEFRRIAGLPSDVAPRFDLFLERVVPEDQPQFLASYGRALNKPRSGESDGRLRRASGEIRHVRLKSVLASGRDGRQELRGTMLDVTDQVRMREELAQAQKMEAVGRLAGGIAHDFNNLLTIVTGNLDLLAVRIGGAPELDDSFQALTSAAGLTRRLLAFGRKAPLMLQLMAPNEIIRSTQSLMRRLVGDEVRLETQLTPNLPNVRVDLLQLERALVNLVVNARDAMPNGGLVRISTSEGWLNGKKQIELSVADEGPGITETDRPHIFEPFYTTRADAGGTGLGLATVLGTAEQHGGTVRVAANETTGCIFTIVLPAAETAAHSVVPGQRIDPPTQTAKSLHVLVVDDEPMIADLIRRMLTSQGHVVQTASHPDAALAIWAEHGEDVDLVICDVVMAHMRGPELVSRLLESGAAPKVLFITGYSEESTSAELGYPALGKPFTAADLCKAISAVP